MRISLLIAIILLVVNSLVDLYVFAALHSYSRSKVWPRLAAWSWAVLTAVFAAVVALAGCGALLPVATWALFAYITIYIVKYFFIIGDVLSRLPFLWRGKRWQWMSWVGFALGLAAFLAIWWGALVNRYNLEVVEVEIADASLPEAFDGLTIAQISDMHTGTFCGDTAFMGRVVDRINSLHPDIVVLTGDIVNQRSAELDPYIPVFSRLKAPMGVYSIMGNHDYGDYARWGSDAERQADVDRLQAMQRRMGMHMLNNSSHTLHRGCDSIVVIGVENIGEKPFRVAGCLGKAYPTLGDSDYKVLLSHNPSHWVDSIADDPGKNIALTLAGHTHAMQIEILGLSPAAARYPAWAGLYADGKGQRLYVNRGVGEIGFPARIGANPEITLFTLKYAK